MPKLIYPSMDVAFPTQRGGLLRLSMILRDHGYIVEDDIVTNIEDFAAGSQVLDLIPRPPNSNTTRLLILFPGGIGDVLCMKSVLASPSLRQVFPNLQAIGFASFIEDRYLLGDSVQDIPVTLYDYPPMEELLESYDAWVSYGTLERQSIKKSLWENYAGPLGLSLPQKSAALVADEQLRQTMQVLLRPGKANIGIQMTSPSFYKSWHPSKGYAAAIALAEAGYAVYLLGSPQQRLELIEGGKPSTTHTNIYDYAGLLRSSGELIAFTDCLDALVTIDSGIMHIAGCLGKPTVALFSLTDAASRCGLYPSVVSICATNDCSPCWNVVETPQCGEPFCTALGDISAAMVVKAVQKILTR